MFKLVLHKEKGVLVTSQALHHVVTNHPTFCTILCTFISNLVIKQKREYTQKYYRVKNKESNGWENNTNGH